MSQELYEKALKKASSETKDYAKSLDGSTDDLKRWKEAHKDYESTFEDTTKGKSLKVTSIGDSIKSLGGEILSTTGNMLLNAASGWLAGLAIQGVTEFFSFAWDQLAHDQENKIAAGDEALAKYKSTQEELANADSWVSSNGARFVELAEGVSRVGNNLSLTTEEFSEYQTLASELANLMPELVTGFDSLGKPVLGATTSISDLNLALRNQKVKEYAEAMKGASDVIAKFEAEALEEQNWIWEESGTKPQLDQLKALNEWYNQGNYKDLTDLNDILSNNDFFQIIEDNQLEESYDLINDYNQGFESVDDQTFNNAVNSILKLYSSYEQKLESQAQSVKTIIPGAFNQLESYLELIDEVPQLENQIGAIVNAFSSDDLMSMGFVGVEPTEAVNNIESWAENLTNYLKYTDTQDVFDKAFSYFDNQSELSVDKWMLEASDAVAELSSYMGDLDILTLEEATGITDIKEDIADAHTLIERAFGEEVTNKLISDAQVSLTDFLNVGELLASGWDAVGKTWDDAIEYIATTAREAELSLNNMQETVATIQSTMSVASTAISESISNTGLSADSINQLSASFEGLENIDTSSLFYNTADGVKLNVDALEKMTKAQDEIVRSDFVEAIAIQNAKIKEQEEIVSKASEETIEAEQDKLNSMRDTMNGYLQAQAQYVAQYKAQQELFSNYSAWQTAQSTANAGDKYTNMKTGLDTAYKAYQDGLVGTDDFKSFAKLISPNGFEDVENFLENYSKAKRYLTEDSSGVQNFLKDLESKGLAEFNKESEKWTYNIRSMMDAAHEMGISEEFMDAMFGRLEDYGATQLFIDSLEEGALKSEELAHEIAKAKIKYAELQAAGADDKILQSQQEVIDSLEAEQVTLNDTIDTFKSVSSEEYIRGLIGAKDHISNLVDMMNTASTETEKLDYLDAIQAVADKYGIKIKIDGFNVEFDESSYQAQLDKYNLGSWESPLQASDFGYAEGTKEAETFINTQERIQAAYADNKEALSELSQYTAEQLKEITLGNKKYDVPGLENAENTLEEIAEKAGYSAEEIDILIDTLASLGLLKVETEIDVDGEEAVEKTKAELLEGSSKLIIATDLETDEAAQKFNELISKGEEGVATTIQVNISGEDSLNNTISALENVPDNTPYTVECTVENQEQVTALEDSVAELNKNGKQIELKTVISTDNSSQEVVPTVQEIQVKVINEDELKELVPDQDFLAKVTNTEEFDGFVPDQDIILIIDEANSDDLNNPVPDSESITIAWANPEILNRILPESETITVDLDDPNQAVYIQVSNLEEFESHFGIKTVEVEVEVKPPSVEDFQTPGARILVGPGANTAKEEIDNTVAYGNSQTTTMGIAGDNTPYIQSVDAAKEYGDGLVATGELTANTYSFDNTVNAAFNSVNGRVLTAYLNLYTKTHPLKYAGTMTSIASHANGTVPYNVLNTTPAYANGKVSLPKDETALVNELGRESYIRSGEWHLLPPGMHFENLKKGDIILNHKQTEDLMKHGKASGHARALASGTLPEDYVMNAYSSGSGGIKFYGNASNNKSSTPKSSTSSNAQKYQQQAANSVAKAAESVEDLVDWIEILLERLQAKTDGLIQKAENAIKLSTALSNYQKAIENISEQIAANQAGATRYQKQADAVGLRSDLVEKVKNGTIDINEYDEDTKKLIDQYQEWHEKALACKQAIADLKEQQVELAQTKLDTIIDKYDLRVEQQDAYLDRYDAQLTYRETAGFSDTGKRQQNIYKAAIKQENDKINYYNKAAAALYNEMQSQLESGLMTEGDDRWRKMQNQLQEYDVALYESKTAIEEWNQSLRAIQTNKLQDALDRVIRWADQLSKMVTLKEARGENVTEKTYKKQITANNDQIYYNDKLLSEYIAEQANYEYGSEKWNEYAEKIANCKNETLDLLIANEELKDAIVEERWEPFTKLQEEVDNSIVELDYLKNTLDASVNSVGEFTSDGYAKIALTGQAISLEKQTIADYTEALKKLDKEYANRNISQDEYNAKQKEFQAGIRDSASNVADYEKELQDLWVSQIEAQNDVLLEDIELWKKAAEEKESYYDYDKKIKDQRKTIDGLKAQAAALEGVTTAAGKAKLAKINADLAEAEESLSDTKREHAYELKISGYDTLANDVTEQLDLVKSELEINAEMQQNVVNLMLETIKTNYATASTEIQNTISNTGLVMSDMTTSAIDRWTNVANAINLASQAMKEVADYKASETASSIKTSQIKTNETSKKDSSGKVITTDDAEKNASKKDTGTSNSADLGSSYNTTLTKAKSLKLSKTSLTLKPGETATLTATVNPSNAVAYYTWSSSDNKIATVSGGTVTAVKKGTATITAKDTNSGLSVTCKVKVKGNSVNNPTGNTGSNTNTHIWKNIPVDASMKGSSRLSKDVSIVDRMKYHGYVGNYTTQKQLWSNLGGSGTYKGTAAQNTWMIQQLKKAGYSKGGLITSGFALNGIYAKAAKSTGDSIGVLTNPGEYILPEEIARTLKPTIKIMEEFNQINKTTPITGGNNSPIVNTNLVFNVEQISNDIDLEAFSRKIQKEVSQNIVREVKKLR